MSYRALDETRSKPWEPFHKLTRYATTPVKPREVAEYRIREVLLHPYVGANDSLNVAARFRQAVRRIVFIAEQNEILNWKA